MHALKQAFGRKRAQIAPDGVFRQAEFGTQRGRHDLPVGLEPSQDELLALFRQHGSSVHENS
jgi:hypothetical protein